MKKFIVVHHINDGEVILNVDTIQRVVPNTTAGSNIFLSNNQENYKIHVSETICELKTMLNLNDTTFQLNTLNS